MDRYTVFDSVFEEKEFILLGYHYSNEIGRDKPKVEKDGYGKTSNTNFCLLRFRLLKNYLYFLKRERVVNENMINF